MSIAEPIVTSTAAADVVEPDSPMLDVTIAAIERRVRWLAMAIVDHANRVRPNRSGLKVGGHQSSSASISAIMTTLWIDALQPGDRVSVKPHASPVLHAINYLLGDLPGEYLTSLREFGGMQSYPSRSKDPDSVDYSTGSVGIGATAPIWGAIARRYLSDHFQIRGNGRQYSLVGDAELDEGACWEAISDPMVQDLGEVVWIIDLNRQSLDRVLPQSDPARLQGMFAAAGWQVITIKYGHLLEELFQRDGGAALKHRIDTMTNAEYQRMLRCTAEELRDRLPNDLELAGLLDTLSDEKLLDAVRNLGGHDTAALRAGFTMIDDARPTVVFAYTIKGFGLSSEGHPENHSALLTEEQMADLGRRLGADLAQPWATFPLASTENRLCVEAAARLRRPAIDLSSNPPVPTDLGRTPTGTTSTQAALGRTLLDLNRVAPEVARRIVTVSPDVSSSTNLGGWVNKVGVWSSSVRPDWFADDTQSLLHWRETPAGQHIELGIAETNLVGLLGELGATWSRWGEPLYPIGVVYDPFVERALEPWSFGIYAGGQSILVGTPSGVTLAAEGGAHQSIKTPSIGLEQPGCTMYEPAFALDAEWMLLRCIAELGKPDGHSSYLRLSTRPIDQSLARVPTAGAARERRRQRVLAGAYALRRAAGDRPAATICTVGALIPDALEAAETLASQGFESDLICISSADLLFRSAQARRGWGVASEWILDTVFRSSRAAPIVTVLDGHPHTLSFLPGINGVPGTHLGVTGFGQSGDLADVYRYHGIDATSIIGAVLDLID